MDQNGRFIFFKWEKVWLTMIDYLGAPYFPTNPYGLNISEHDLIPVLAEKHKICQDLEQKHEILSL